MDLPITDLDASVAFLYPALAPPGTELMMRREQLAGFGVAGKPATNPSDDDVASPLSWAADRCCCQRTWQALPGRGDRSRV